MSVSGNGSAAMVWACTKNSNCFMRKGLHNTWFSAEPGNLYNKHSYKYSGLAHPGASFDVRMSNDDVLTVAKPSKKNVAKPAKAAVASEWKQNPRRCLRSIAKEASRVGRPDLKRPAQARMSALLKSVRVKKALAKK